MLPLPPPPPNIPPGVKNNEAIPATGPATAKAAPALTSLLLPNPGLPSAEPTSVTPAGTPKAIKAGFANLFMVAIIPELELRLGERLVLLLAIIRLGEAFLITLFTLEVLLLFLDFIEEPVDLALSFFLITIGFLPEVFLTNFSLPEANTWARCILVPPPRFLTRMFLNLVIRSC